MKISGTATMTADRAVVWAALNDPAVLVRTIPGCRRLEALGDDAYKMTVATGVGSIKGVYDGEVRLSDQQEPGSFRMRAQGAGAPGTIGADVHVSLADATGGGTALSYDADAVVGGMIGGVGQRMLAGVSKRLAGEFFAAVDAHLAGAPPVAASGLPGTAGSPNHPGSFVAGGPDPSTVAPPPSVQPAAPVRQAAPAAGAVYTAPAAAQRESGQGFGVGVLSGAGAVLAGVLVGWALGRRRS